MYVCQKLETGRKKVLVKIYGVSITVAACVCLYQRLCFVCLFVITHLSFHEAAQVKSLYINILKQWNTLKISLFFKEFTILTGE